MSHNCALKSHNIRFYHLAVMSHVERRWILASEATFLAAWTNSVSPVRMRWTADCTRPASRPSRYELPVTHSEPRSDKTGLSTASSSYQLLGVIFTRSHLSLHRHVIFYSTWEKQKVKQPRLCFCGRSFAGSGLMEKMAPALVTFEPTGALLGARVSAD